MKSALLLILLTAGSASAQELRQWEFYGGFALQRSEVREYFRQTPILYGIRNVNETLTGFDFAVTENLKKRRVGGTARVSGHYATPTQAGISTRQRMHSFLYGPRFNLGRVGPLQPFAHVLGGLALADARVVVPSTGPHVSTKTFTALAGGGIDIALGKRLAVRAFQAEYVYASIFSTKPHSVRASAGIVLYAGK
jgi:hypothetical protein